MNKKAILVLENGLIFHGNSIGKNGLTTGEVVFNTSITGYQEILSDPSYFNQIIVFTQPYIGNTGINTKDSESDKIYAKGIICNSICNNKNHYDDKMSLQKYILKNNIIAISNVDTRKITRIIRKYGIQKGCIFTEKNSNYYNAHQKLKKKTNNNTKKNTFTIYSIDKNNLNTNYRKQKKNYFNVIVYDFGIKKNILNILYKRKCNLYIAHPHTNFKKIVYLFKKKYKKKIHGVFLSNGPGNPKNNKNIIKDIIKFEKNNIPIFGICLGHQLIGMAYGSQIKKMKHGHHGSNHPVQDILQKKIIITAQNHNFNIKKKNLPENIIITHKSLFDDSIQGISIKNKPVFGFQGHPESSPGPHDTLYLFDTFISNMKKYNNN